MQPEIAEFTLAMVLVPSFRSSALQRKKEEFNEVIENSLNVMCSGKSLFRWLMNWLNACLPARLLIFILAIVKRDQLMLCSRSTLWNWSSEVSRNLHWARLSCPSNTKVQWGAVIEIIINSIRNPHKIPLDGGKNMKEERKSSPMTKMRAILRSHDSRMSRFHSISTFLDF